MNIDEIDGEPMILGEYIKKYDFKKQFKIVAIISVSVTLILLVADYLLR
jgi:hypothetical protein